MPMCWTTASTSSGLRVRRYSPHTHSLVTMQLGLLTRPTSPESPYICLETARVSA